ncbi:hypothetical protein ACULTK_004347 [Yersinia enterocolitica]|uniref:hypothetical protein n=1 Tax=Yersinia enterocolitica TaxID=630 RepID=UPI0005E689DF|nr:hypothetical protein [Yersinia enterocolitica]EKN3508945.1 hypothetical protein [Yersinia enterocolitica]EKN3960396.1 hypothetical protein [Yersinia enterocolitica]EKP3823990.1 hypothetical protein [Yersinia enterocolitica]CQD72808.1 Uncharacterised protein [Yersinia enterocolitica]HDL8127044.1 hypothetical protein [Yersinia enterocolitica]
MSFFTTDGVRALISTYLAELNKIEKNGNEFSEKRNEYINLLMKSFHSEPNEWDKYAQLNIVNVGDSFIKMLNSFSSNEDKLDTMFSVCFRFLLERYITSPEILTMSFRQIKDFGLYRVDEFSPIGKEQITYAEREMPIDLHKHILSSGNVDILKALSNEYRNAEELKDKWDSEIKEREVKVDNLKLALIKYENAFNFVGLYDGFKELSDEKVKEKKKSFWLVCFLALMVLTPLIYEVRHLSLNKENYTSWVDYFSVIPVFSITIILIYYFKISLQNYNSIKAQLSQIELRKTLCRFIQNYGDYSIGMKQQDPDSLAKFENIIFSSIVTNGDNVPATFDGLEQIAKIIGNLKNSK